MVPVVQWLISRTPVCVTVVGYYCVVADLSDSIVGYLGEVVDLPDSIVGSSGGMADL